MNTPVADAGQSHVSGRIPDVNSRFAELYEGVDDLIKRVADTENPEIRKIRAKVHASMMVAKRARLDLGSAVARPRRHLDGPDYGPEPVGDDEPGEALRVALLVGLGLGVIMSRQL